MGSFTDIYIATVSSTHNVCAKDIFVAIVSTIVETDKPELEIAPGLNLLGPIHEKLVIPYVLSQSLIQSTTDSSPLLPCIHPQARVQLIIFSSLGLMTRRPISRPLLKTSKTFLSE